MILGTGIDIIEIERIKKAINRWGKSFIEHIFREEEIAYAEKHQSPTQHYAVRFAAKEAVYKAVGTEPHLSWKDILISNDRYGRPQAAILNKPFPNKIYLSLSHSKYYAVASAIIEKSEEELQK